MRLKENKKNKNKREVNLTIQFNDNGWSSGNNRKLYRILVDNKFHEYRIATKDEVEKWKKNKEDNFGSKIEIEREVA